MNNSNRKINYFNKAISKNKVVFNSSANDFNNKQKNRQEIIEEYVFGNLRRAFEVFFLDSVLENKKDIGEIVREVREIFWKCEALLKKIDLARSSLSEIEFKFIELLGESTFYDRILPTEEEKQKKIDKFLEELFFKEDKDMVWFYNFLNDFFSFNFNSKFLNYSDLIVKINRLGKVKEKLCEIARKIFKDNDKSRKLSKTEKQFLYENLRSDSSIARFLRHKEIKKLITQDKIIIKISKSFGFSSVFELLARQFELFREEAINAGFLMNLLEDREQKKQQSSDRQVKELDLNMFILPSINKKD